MGTRCISTWSSFPISFYCCAVRDITTRPVYPLITSAIPVTPSIPPDISCDTPLPFDQWKSAAQLQPCLSNSRRSRSRRRPSYAVENMKASLTGGPQPTGYLAAYLKQLQSNPLRTKMLTSGTLSALQELLASWLAHDRSRHGHYFSSRIPKMA